MVIRFATRGSRSEPKPPFAGKGEDFQRSFIVYVVASITYLSPSFTYCTILKKWECEQFLHALSRALCPTFHICALCYYIQQMDQVSLTLDHGMWKAIHIKPIYPRAYYGKKGSVLVVT